MMRISLLVMVLAACSGKKANDDCKLVLDDPAQAMVKVTERYPKDPVKVAETIERCVAPTGDECERIHKIVQAIPAMMGGGPSSLPSLEICRTSMTPEMRRCMLPSYVLKNTEECTAVLKKMAETTISDMPIKPSAKPRVAEDCDGPRLEISKDGMKLTTGPKDKRVTAEKEGADYAWLEEQLKTAKAAVADCSALELAGERGVRYQSLIVAMDTAVKVGFIDVGLDDGMGDATPDSPSTRPPAGSDALKKAPVLVITKEELQIDSKPIARVSEVVDGPDIIEALTKALPPSTDGMVILQADESTDVIVITRAVGTMRKAGYDNVLFAVKNR